MSTPQNLVQLHNGAKSFGTKTLFEGATFSVNEGEHIGVIGPNGAGKTTLFKILAGELELDHGTISRYRNLSIGYLRQHDTWDENQTLEEYLSQVEQTPIWDLKRLGVDLGLREELFDAPIKSLSGGYRMRAKLLHLLGQRPNLMMLDEPTNYLDLETLLVLEEFLQSFEGAFLLISHDREFLRRTTDHILEIESGEFTKFGGNIDDYFEQKALLRTQLEKAASGQAAKRKEVLDFAARFGAKATKARQVQSRLKLLEKMETIELKALPVAAKIRIPEPTHVGRVVIKVEDSDLGYPEKPILQRVSLKIESGDHVGVVGYNGAGKSTFLKSIAQELPCLHGAVEWGYQVNCAYYAQHVSERLLPEDTVLKSLQRTAHNDVRQQDILDLAGSLLFQGDQVQKKVKILSGGEKARVALGQMLLKKSPVLLLDEPTNHLDFYTVESLTQALADYKGTVIIVSHDRGFVRRIANKILEVKSGRAMIYPGNYDDYVWSVQRRHAAGESSIEEHPPLPRVSRTQGSPTANSNLAEPKESAPVSNDAAKSQIKALEAERRTFDKTIQDLDRKIKILEARMNDQGAKLSGAQGTEAADLSRELGASQRKIQDLEAEMLAAMEKREAIATQIQNLKS